MSDLIERMERDSNADRELDRDIARSLESLPTDPFKGPSAWDMHKGMFWVLGKRDTASGPAEEKFSRTALRYTSSIDAAMTLVPPGCDWLINARGGYACVWEEKESGRDGSWDAHHYQNLAKALCVAALKARFALTPALRQEGS